MTRTLCYPVWVAGFIGAALGAGSLAFGLLAVRCLRRSAKACQVNPGIQKDCDKVVHSMETTDLGNKTAFCRCWRSQKFPMCDGTHNTYNQEYGDNVGPLIITQQSSS
uniref:CDGSH iron sulfur domain 1 n=1 Tax=Eptatretus burgeri TaxID=7764 RepID=A0A8C4N822_EPTBU